MRIYASVFDIPRAGVDASDFLTKRPFRSVCRMVCCKGFPTYVALDGLLRKTRHCRACNGGSQVPAGVPPGVLAELLGGLPGVLATLLGVLPGGLPGELAQIWPSYLVSKLLDPDDLIG